jgi:sodium-dependent dicarboxylate transporter 2/3/5
MWMSNIAAAAMMFATLRPLFRDVHAAGEGERSFRKAMLLGIAFAADLGGIGTPIGTGPNLIAIGAVADRHRITFFDWIVFAAPLAGLMVLLAFALIASLFRVRGQFATSEIRSSPLTRKGWSIVAIFSVAVLAWVLEPVHGVPAALTALAVAAALFSTRLLGRSDLKEFEWDTLLLIAGGLTLGELFQASGLAAEVANALNWNALPRPVLLFFLAIACASISAVASNTAAAAVLIQIALEIAPSPSIAVIVALSASMGLPFVISTPPNSMAYGQGGITARDLFVPGAVLMVVGCVFVAFAGPPILRLLGVP